MTVRFSLVLILVCFISPSAGFSQDRPARIVIDSVEVPANGSGFVNRYGVTREEFAAILKTITEFSCHVDCRLPFRPGNVILLEVPQ